MEINNRMYIFQDLWINATLEKNTEGDWESWYWYKLHVHGCDQETELLWRLNGVFPSPYPGWN